MTTSLRLPDIGVDFGFSQQIIMNKVTTEFGDGYNQRAIDGINATQYVYSVSWTNIDTERKDILLNFFLGTNGVTAFKWTPPDVGVDMLFVCDTPTTVPIAAGIWTINVTLTQVFDN